VYVRTAAVCAICRGASRGEVEGAVVPSGRSGKTFKGGIKKISYVIL